MDENNEKTMHDSDNHTLDLSKTIKTSDMYLHKCVGVSKVKCDCDNTKVYIDEAGSQALNSKFNDQSFDYKKSNDNNSHLASDMNTDVSSTSDNRSNDEIDDRIGSQALNYRFRDRSFNDLDSSHRIPSDASDRSKSKSKNFNKKMETSKGYRPRNKANTVGNL